MIRSFDVWSVLKFSTAFYFTLACIILVAGVVLWVAATAVGVRENIEQFIGDLIASNEFRFVAAEVLRVAAICAVVMVLIGTAVNIFLAVVYNLISDLVGGIQVTADDHVAEPATAQAPTRLLPASELAGGASPARGRPVSDSSPAAAAPGHQGPAFPAPVKPSEPPRGTVRWVPKHESKG